MGPEEVSEFPGLRSRSWGIRASGCGVRHTPGRDPPHPYFGCKILVFMSLQAWLRCKIVKTKEFPAKSSRIRSYRLKIGKREEGNPAAVLDDHDSIVRAGEEMICKAAAAGPEARAPLAEGCVASVDS
jgi:hypothetical protein